ncbi:MAG: ROK family protein [Acidimicrobiales bacterium]
MPDTDYPRPDDEAIVAVDIGATSIKVARTTARGALIDDVVRVPTPYPCSPARLVDVVAQVIRSSVCRRAGVGFPGAMLDGRVLEPGNLSRPGGVTTPVDATLHEAWTNYPIEAALREASACDVRVVNDATFAALGYCQGAGRELVVTLGTGFGIALVVGGGPVRIRDVGAEVFADDLTYDEALGEHGRARDEVIWRARLAVALAAFVEEFEPDVVHVGGGNARFFVDEPVARLARPTVVHDATRTLSGAARLFA